MYDAPWKSAIWRDPATVLGFRVFGKFNNFPGWGQFWKNGFLEIEMGASGWRGSIRLVEAVSKVVSLSRFEFRKKWNMQKEWKNLENPRNPPLTPTSRCWAYHMGTPHSYRLMPGYISGPSLLSAPGREYYIYIYIYIYIIVLALTLSYSIFQSHYKILRLHWCYM